MKIFSFVFFIVLVFLGITFSLQNAEKVTVYYFIGHMTLPLSLLITMVFSIGGIVGLIVGCWLLVKSKIKNRYLTHRLKSTEKEMQQLRAIVDRHV